jgi:DNA gyrase subunit A
MKQLFKMTPLQGTFSINMLALVDGEPRLLPLKRSLQLFIEHRYGIITRRSRYELDQAKQRAHVLEGLRIALANLDEIIATIRNSRSADTARKNLRKKFRLSDIQAGAILDMPLRRLAALERKKIETEYKEVLKRIKFLKDLLRSRKKIYEVIKEELTELKANYGSPRRTVIMDQSHEGDKLITARELLPAEPVVVAVSWSGRVCRWPTEDGLELARGRQKDPLAAAVPANTRDTLYLFTSDGRAVIIPMHQVPVGSAPGDGPSLAEFSAGPVKAVIGGVALSADHLSGYLLAVSRQGRVKRISLNDLSNVRGHEAIVMGLEAGDTLQTAFLTLGKSEIVLVSAQGQAIRFAEEDVRPMGLPATGVLGMKLAKGDGLVGGGPVKSRGELVIVTEKGWGKRTGIAKFPKQGRYGQGVIAMPTGKEGGKVVVAAVVNLGDRVMLISEKKNSKTVYARALPKMARGHKGKALMSIRGRDRIACLITLVT